MHTTKTEGKSWRVSVHRFLLEFWFDFKSKQKITNIVKYEHPRKRLKRRQHRRKRARWWPRKRHRLIRNHHQRHLGRHSTHAPFCIINLLFFCCTWLLTRVLTKKDRKIRVSSLFSRAKKKVNVSGVRHRGLIIVLSRLFHKFSMNFYLFIWSFLINF